MAIRWIDAAGNTWKTQEKTSVRKYERTYIDFRQYIYPPIDSTLTYTLVTALANQPGSHNLTGGYANYILSMPSTFTLFVRCLPAFAYDVGTDQVLASWYVDADNYLSLYYEADDQKIKVRYKNGIAEQTLESAAYISDVTLQVWHNIAITIDRTTGTDAGSALYINQAEVDTTWSGAIDAQGMEYPLFSLRHEDDTAGEWIINQVRCFPNKLATATQVANLFQDLEEEEIVWNLNGEGCGRTRCNVSRHIMSLGLERSVAEPSNGSQGANRFSAILYSHGGEYADDQYAAFDPTAELFNGTSAQKYLQKQARLECESWYGTSWEPLFIGRLDKNLFSRKTGAGNLTTVDITAEDGVSEIAREVKRKARSFEGKKLSDATEADSLVHLIARLSTQKDVYNYLANSSFENATIAFSWIVSGGTAPTFTKVAGGLFGSNEGQLDYDDAACTVTQTVTMIPTASIKKLNKGESYNFSLWCKCADAVSNAASLIKLAEHDALGSHDDTDTAIVLTGGEGWKRFEVTHTITDDKSDRLVITIGLGDDTVLSCDGAMLIQGTRAPNFWVLNDNDGDTGVTLADDADYASYDTVGFDVDAVNVTHPWVFVPSTESVWDHLKELGNATGCMYLGMDACGTLKLRAKLKTGYTDPSSLETITSVRSVDSVIEMQRANKIVGHAASIQIFTKPRAVWFAASVPEFVGDNETPRVLVSTGEYFPSPATYGDFYAKYQG